VTAVQVMPVSQPSEWQREFSRFDKVQAELLEQRHAVEVTGK
jgi:formate dehydrogenase major subunit